ncbi:MAG: aldose 1-epimerase [Flavobacteriaceae bacterium]
MKEFILNNKYLKVVFLDYGAIIHQLWVKDKNGIPTNVINGLETPEAYLDDTWSRGAIIGRFAGRLENPIHIEGIPFEIEHKEGVLLHSGSSGWNKKKWRVIIGAEEHVLHFSYTCPAKSSGFPGEVKACITYSLKGSNLYIEYYATTNASTHINLTNHAYFNVNPSGRINSQILYIESNEVLALKNTLIPTGLKNNVKNTSFNFKTPTLIGKKRLDDYFVLNKSSKKAASIYAPYSGIEMSVYTNQPGVVVFTPPHFDAICFETQKFSNTPNIKSFPTTLIHPGENYSHNTRFEFKLKKNA